MGMRLPISHVFRLGAVAFLVATLGAAGGVGCGGTSPSPFGQAVAASDDDDDASAGTFGVADSGVSTGAPLGAGCATASSEAKRQPVYLLFVLDGSGSMSQDNKWTAVVPALQSIFSQMESSGDTGIGAGLIVFSDTSDPTTGSGPYPSSADVPIGLVDKTHETALDMRLAGMPQDGTPTHAALMGGYGEIEPYTPAAPLHAGGKKVLVLITDGVPTDDCMSVPLLSTYSSNPCIVEAGNELQLAAPKGPIETFVIGVGDFAAASFFGLGGIDPSFLGYLAQAGGTGAHGCNPNETSSTSDLCYFEIDPSTAPTASELQQKFETALNAIRGQVVSCTYPLQGSDLGNVDPMLVNVEVDGKTIVQNAMNGWTYDNPTMPTEIILHGAACTTAETDLTAKVSIVVGCATQTR
jgi:von Willebrand factor type A domain